MLAPGFDGGEYALARGGIQKVAMALMLKDGDDCGDGLDDEGTVVRDDAAIVFAELANG